MPPQLSHAIRSEITAYLARNETNDFIVSKTGVSLAQIKRMRCLWVHYGVVVPIGAAQQGRPRSIIADMEDDIMLYLRQHPTAYLDEIANSLSHTYDIQVDPSLISGCFKRLGWTRKKAN